ncbi:Putative phage integrase (fragment) [Methylorubrum extorquens]|uniref:Phage integrase n=1 Tax=Methylorubrum extorquens TaxID=408 RepID=A0A2N9AXI8_METEX
MTVAQRSPNDEGHDRPIPLPHGGGDHSHKRVPKLRSASGQKDDHPTILAMMTRWLSEIEGVQTKQSVMQHVIAIREFAQSQPSNRTVERISRRIAGEFVSGVLMQAGASQKTVNRKISSLSSLWRWLRKRGFVEENPWEGQGSFVSAVKSVRPKRAYEAPELVRLLIADPRSAVGSRYGLVLFDLMRLGLLTGCRIGELCQLRVDDVIESQQAFRIPQGKTESARRIMPVHRAVWPIIQRRIASSLDGWIFSGLTPAGPDGKRSWIVVKRYATFRQAVLGQSGGVDFHSFRRSFATYLERASTHSMAVNSSVIAELMGHVKPTLALAV